MIGRNFPETKVVDNKESVNIIEKAPLSTLLSDEKNNNVDKNEIIKEIERLLKQLL